jgi:hypothetical protein
MTLEFVLSKMRQTLQKLWAVDTAAPSARRDSQADRLACATFRPLYSRNGIRVSVATEEGSRPGVNPLIRGEGGRPMSIPAIRKPETTR